MSFISRVRAWEVVTKGLDPTKPHKDLDEHGRLKVAEPPITVKTEPEPIVVRVNEETPVIVDCSLWCPQLEEKRIPELENLEVRPPTPEEVVELKAIKEDPKFVEATIEEICKVVEEIKDQPRPDCIVVPTVVKRRGRPPTKKK